MRGFRYALACIKCSHVWKWLDLSPRETSCSVSVESTMAFGDHSLLVLGSFIESTGSQASLPGPIPGSKVAMTRREAAVACQRSCGDRLYSLGNLLLDRLHDLISWNFRHDFLFLNKISPGPEVQARPQVARLCAVVVALVG